MIVGLQKFEPLKLQSASAKIFASSSSLFKLCTSALLPWIHNHLQWPWTETPEAGPSWCCSSSIETENTTGNTTRKPFHVLFSPTSQFSVWLKSHCRTETWLPRGWSPLEFIRTSAVSYDASFDVKDKTRVYLVFGGRGFTYNEDSQVCSAQNLTLESLSLWN